MFTSSMGRVAVIYVSVLSVLVAACGNTGATTTTPATSTQGELGFGSPADPGDADRTVEIDASDEFLFDPADLTVRVGETITFRVVNDGSLIHEFTLGDRAAQDEHEDEMAEDEIAHDQPNVVTIPAGETMEITWTFTGPGTVLIGCHQPGHYAAGMKGQVTVES